MLQAKISDFIVRLERNVTKTLKRHVKSNYYKFSRIGPRDPTCKQIRDYEGEWLELGLLTLG